jgi:hypothetical protein
MESSGGQPRRWPVRLALAVPRSVKLIGVGLAALLATGLVVGQAIDRRSGIGKAQPVPATMAPRRPVLPAESANGQPLPSATGGSLQPSAPTSAPPRPSAASASHITGPITGHTAAAPPAKPPTTTAGRSPPAAAFSPISVQAERPGNALYGAAEVASCAACEGGARVRYIGGANEVVVFADVPVAGSRTVTVAYETDGLRVLKVSINGRAPIVFALNGVSWVEPERVQFTAVIPAGRVQIRLYNDESPAPDADLVVIS